MTDLWLDKVMPDPFSAGYRLRQSLQAPRRWAGRLKRRIRQSVEKSVKGDRVSAGVSPYFDFAGDGDAALFTKRALICYVGWPFHASAEQLRTQSHTNGRQSVEIAKAFNRLGFAVDVVDWTDETFVPIRGYDVFLGMHSNFARLAPLLPDAIKIYYATGPYWKYLQHHEQARKRELDSRFGIDAWIPSRINEGGFFDMADSVLSIGNAFVANKYKIENGCVHRIDNSAIVTPFPVDIDSKDYARARKNFLWLGSVDMVRKGLPLLLDVFSRTSDAHLWVCGSFDTAHDRPLIRAYRQELFHSANIHPLGWMDLHSERFARVCHECAWSILPSCGEGMAGGVLDCMARGVAPVVSAEVGVDTDRCGATFADLSVESIADTVRTMCDTPQEECRRHAVIAREIAETRYTLDAFRSNIERRLAEILSTAAESPVRGQVIYA